MLRYKPPPCSAEKAQAVIQAYREYVADRRLLALRGARVTRELERTGAHFHAGASSIGHFAEMNGIPAQEAREHANLGRAIEGAPSIEKEVVAGTIPPSSAAILGELGVEEKVPGEIGFRVDPDRPLLVRPDDRWLEHARSMNTKDLRRLYLQRVDEVRAGEAVSAVTAYVTAAVRDDLDRARALLSRKAHVPLTIGQTLRIVLDDWLAVHDPMRTTPGTRRLPDTSTIPGDRYVPADVDRAVRARTGDRCLVPLCDGSFWVHRAHQVPHRDGGSREADNLALLCDRHHWLYDAGKIRISGPVDAPIVTDASGTPIDGRRAWPWRDGESPSRQPPPGAMFETGPPPGAKGKAAKKPDTENRDTNVERKARPNSESPDGPRPADSS